MNWYKVQVVPEPGTFMALGLGGLALIRRKRKQERARCRMLGR